MLPIEITSLRHVERSTGYHYGTTTWFRNGHIAKCAPRVGIGGVVPERAEVRDVCIPDRLVA